jgi:hypothetical protein
MIGGFGRKQIQIPKDMTPAGRLYRRLLRVKGIADK